MTLSSNLLIDRVELALDISHTWIGDLTVTLTSPDGTISLLVNQPGWGGTEQDNINFVFDSVQFWGERGNGNWTLGVSDGGDGDTGFLNSWALTLFGDTITGNDQYIYTDE